MKGDMDEGQEQGARWPEVSIGATVGVVTGAAMLVSGTFEVLTHFTAPGRSLLGSSVATVLFDGALAAGATYIALRVYNRLQRRARRETEERMRLSAELERERQMLRQFLALMPDHIYFKDRESRFILVNEAMARDHGFATPHDMLGKTDFDLFTREHAQPAYDDEQEIIRTGRIQIRPEEKETHADGSVTWCSTIKAALVDGAGRIVGTCGISRDITPLKRAEEERHAAETRQREVMERSDRLNALGVLAAGLAHELSNPLQGMLSHLHLVQRTLPPDFKGRENLAMVMRGIEALSALSRKMLLLGRAEATADTQGVLGEAVDFVVQLLDGQLRRAKIEVVRDVRHAGVRLTLPRREAVQVLLNILMNAMDAMPNGGTLTLRGGVSGSTATLEVADTGVGMDEETRRRIFTPFFTTKGARGTGLGLPVVASILRERGGSIDIRSAPGQGTRVFLEMPVAREAGP